MYKHTLTDVNLKDEVVKNNKFLEFFFINMLNSLMPKIPKWSDKLSKTYSK